MSFSFDDKRPSKVLEHLFIGSRAHAKNRGMLRELGINRVLNVTPPKTMDPSNGVSNFFEKDKSMTYRRIPVFDNRGEDLLQHFSSCISFIEQGSFYGKVLVHCSKGVSRSSTVCAAYLMGTRGLTKDAALAYLRSQRPIVNPHEGFTAQLDTFEAKLTGERKAAIAEGQPPKYPDDLLGRKPEAKGISIGTSIGPSRGPSPPSPNTNARNDTPTGSSNRPPAGPFRSPPRGSSTSQGLVYSPLSGSASPQNVCSRSPTRKSLSEAIGPFRRPGSSLPSVCVTQTEGDSGGDERKNSPEADFDSAREGNENCDSSGDTDGRVVEGRVIDNTTTGELALTQHKNGDMKGTSSCHGRGGRLQADSTVEPRSGHDANETPRANGMLKPGKGQQEEGRPAELIGLIGPVAAPIAQEVGHRLKNKGTDVSHKTPLATDENGISNEGVVGYGDPKRPRDEEGEVVMKEEGRHNRPRVVERSNLPK